MNKFKGSLKFDERAQVLADTLKKESDRGCAVLGAEIVANGLESLLRASFRSDKHALKITVDPLFKGFGPLSTFSAKIEIAYALFLIPKIIRERLELIRKIRNYFAHNQMVATFSDIGCHEMLEILANGRDKSPKTSDKHNDTIEDNRTISEAEFRNRLTFITPVAQTATIIEVLERFVVQGKDIRGIVTGYERDGSLEYD